MTVVAERRTVKALKDRSSKELRRELSGLIAETAEKLQKMAFIVAELESRGEDLSGLRISLLPALRLVAAGRMDAEAVLRLADRPWLIQSVGRLPLPEQKRLLDKGTVPVLVEGEAKDTPILSLPLSTIQQVFAQDHVRSPEEQRVYLASIRRRKSDGEEPKRHYLLRADKGRGGFWVGQAFVKVSEVVPVLAELAGPLDLLVPDDAETITVRVTAAEKEKLRVLANQRKLPDWHLLREAFRAMGMI
jgi:hypothetical protein